MGLPVRTLALMLCLTLAPVFTASAEEFEYREYVVKPGDTLWDITKSMLEDAFQWPIVWRENLRINNPDLIYPGQVILVPVRLIPPGMTRIKPPGIEEPSGVVEEVPPVEPGVPGEIVPLKAEYIITREGLLESGYITWDVPHEGEITGAASERQIYGLDDKVYVKTREAVEAGDKFYVIRKEALVEHPVTEKKLGYLVRVLGTLEVTESGTSDLKAVVIESFDFMKPGDYLDRYYEVFPPLQTGEPRRPQVKALVLTARNLRALNGTFDVVFIDKGKEDELMEGDVLMTLVHGTDDMRNSVIQLVNLRDTTALGIIMESENEVRRGDVVEGLK